LCDAKEVSYCVFEQITIFSDYSEKSLGSVITLDYPRIVRERG